MIFDQAQRALHVVYPPRCLACGEMVEANFALCGGCRGQTPFVSGLVCDLCGIPLPGGERGEVACCDGCLADPPPWSKGRAALIYADVARQLVLRLKHGDRQDIAKPAASWMARAAGDIALSDMVLVPVPLHWRRFLRRGFNQSALLSQNLARQMGVTHCPDALLRRRATAPLSGDKAARVAALEGALDVNPRRLRHVAGRHVLLVDDVMTTGATLRAAANALRSASVRKIHVITLARVAFDT